MNEQELYRPNNHVVDFGQLEKARKDKPTAEVLRLRWGLDASKTGRVFCDEEECRERLNAGQLPPVLTPAQFSRISSGLPYGDPDADSSCAIEGFVSGAAHDRQSDPFAGHPDYHEYLKLSGPVKEALRHDFKSFLFLKQRGKLQSVVEAVHAQLARDVETAETEARRRSDERASADVVNSPQYKALAARLKGNRNYPGLCEGRSLS
ncbi:MAG: hypothetical protein AAB433_18040 [Nitrospirota bacterium]